MYSDLLSCFRFHWFSVVHPLITGPPLTFFTFLWGFDGFRANSERLWPSMSKQGGERERGPCRTFQIVYLTVSRLALYDYANSMRENILCALTIVFLFIWEEDIFVCTGLKRGCVKCFNSKQKSIYKLCDILMFLRHLRVHSAGFNVIFECSYLL